MKRAARPAAAEAASAAPGAAPQGAAPQGAARRAHHLRVPVLPDERALIEAQAQRAGMSVARFLREVGQGYRIGGVVDYEQVRELARINGDLGRLGGLLKLWLTNDERTAQFGEATLRAVLARIEATQEQMGEVMMKVVQPRAGREPFSG
ncbi:conjugal transfer transcriptional regulator TraJ [Thauera sinica]|uniref:Conjugal transfer transcriptional regulator TraJ n=1 Tax=Thauera sinica TaxID=2665146 RepID=A0ABW1AV53_9RHOO|nr:conjugal transfer transcriptional regulator TraJ [Thauera sp. K11]